MRALIIAITLIVGTSSAILANEKEKVKESNNKTEKTLHVASLNGKITDASTGEGLAGVAVKLEGLNKTVYTDFDGNFSITDLVPGKYTVSANLITYKELREDKIDLTEKSAGDISLALESKY